MNNEIYCNSVGLILSQKISKGFFVIFIFLLHAYTQLQITKKTALRETKPFKVPFWFFKYGYLKICLMAEPQYGSQPNNIWN